MNDACPRSSTGVKTREMHRLPLSDAGQGCAMTIKWMLMGLRSEVHVGSDLCLIFIHFLLLNPDKKQATGLGTAVPVHNCVTCSAFSGAVQDICWSRQQLLREEMEWMWRDERNERAIKPRCGGRRRLATPGINKCRWGSRVCNISPITEITLLFPVLEKKRARVFFPAW